MPRSMSIRSLGVAFGLMLPLFAGGCSSHSSQPFTISREEAITRTARVKKVDMKTRKVTLVGEDGNTFTIHAGDEVRNLDQVRAGDTVAATFYEMVAAEIRKPTDEERANPATYVGAVGRAEKGEMPAGLGAESIRLVGKITMIDKNTDHATITDLDGQAYTFKVRDSSNLDLVKVGDPVVLTITQAVAIAVEPVN